MLNAIALSQKKAARKKKCIEVAVNEQKENKYEKNMTTTEQSHSNAYKYLNQ